MNRNRKEQIFLGIALIGIAVMAAAGGMGFLGGLSFITIILTVVFGLTLIRSFFPINFTGILFSLAFLGIIYDKQLGIENLTPWTLLLIALLGSIGLSLIFGHNHAYHHEHHHDYKHQGAGEGNIDNSEVINEPDDSYVHQYTQLGGTTKYINTEDFKEADLECKFGGLTAYFNNAKVPGHTAKVHIYANFAGVELFFPKEWTVVDNLHCSLGGVSYDNSPSPDGEVTIILDGEVSIGGVDIKFI